MKLLFYGNCQVQVVMHAIAASNPQVSCEYAGNSKRVTKHDPVRADALMDWCDHIISQPIQNRGNPDHHLLLRARFGDRLSFLPYIFVDGLYALCAAPGLNARGGIEGRAGIVGEDHVAPLIRAEGLDRTLARFAAGEIDFAHAQRLEASLAELDRREKHADVRVGQMLRDGYRDEVLMLTHNHPHPRMINEIARLLAHRLGLAYAPVLPDMRALYRAITLPEFGKVLSPQTVAELGLRRAHDPGWLDAGRRLIARIADAATLQAGR